MDLITDLPPSAKYTAIMVVVDHGLTKGIVLIPTTKTVDADGVARLYLDQVYKRYGLPDSIISDRDPRFASKVFTEIGRLLNIKLKMSTAYHPQTDGATERANQTIETYLWIYCHNQPERWTEWLPMAEFCYNNLPHATQKESPFYLQMGVNPITIPPIMTMETKAPAAQNRLEQLKKAREEALAAHELAAAHMADRKRNPPPQLSKGDKVWLSTKNLKFLKDHAKLKQKKTGPFTITEVIGPLTYRLKLPKTWKIHPVFHAALLSRYQETEAHGPSHTDPPPDLIEGEEEYEVEEIRGHRMHRSKLQFLIKWKGYSEAENTWEPLSNLKHAQSLLESYKKRKKLD